MEFQTSPQAVIEALIHINNQLRLPEAAVGKSRAPRQTPKHCRCPRPAPTFAVFYYCLLTVYATAYVAFDIVSTCFLIILLSSCLRHALPPVLPLPPCISFLRDDFLLRLQLCHHLTDKQSECV